MSHVWFSQWLLHFFKQEINVDWIVIWYPWPTQYLLKDYSWHSSFLYINKHTPLQIMYISENGVLIKMLDLGWEHFEFQFSSRHRSQIGDFGTPILSLKLMKKNKTTSISQFTLDQHVRLQSIVFNKEVFIFQRIDSDWITTTICKSRYVQRKEEKCMRKASSNRSAL